MIFLSNSGLFPLIGGRLEDTSGGLVTRFHNTGAPMPDTYKEKTSVKPIIIPWSFVHITYPNWPSTIGQVVLFDNWTTYQEIDTGFSDSSYYRTTERNCKKNGGSWPSKLKPLSARVELVQVATRKARRFDLGLKKFITFDEPLYAPRIVRQNYILDPKVALSTAQNDLQRFVHEVILVQTYLGSQNPNTGEYRFVSGSVPKCYEMMGLTLTDPTPSVQANTAESRYATEVAEVSDQSIRKLYDYIKNQPADLGTDIAEGRQTIRMFFELSKRLAEFLTSAKKLNFGKAVSSILPVSKKAVANDFLAYRYGIAPLISDLYGLQKEISDRLSGQMRYKATGKSTKLFTFPNKIVEVTVKHYCLFSVNDDLLDSLSRLGLTNPANVAWELVPFSFVVDWFYPIGPYLSKLTTLDHLTVKSIHRTIVIREFLWGDELPETNSSPHYLNAIGSLTWEIKNFSCTRTKLSSMPLIPIPSIKSPFSFGHVSNFIALLTQALSKRS